MNLDLRDRVAIGLGAAAILLAGAGAWLLLASGSGDGGAAGEPLASDALAVDVGSTAAAAATSGALVVDVEGGVVHPGVVTLPPGARVADALRAAGGYAPDADLDAAARALNLAAPLADGGQVYVPVIGVAIDAPAEGSGQSGLVNLNTASGPALESLPSIGPVTAGKIISARAEQPFSTLEELLERKVLNSGQLEEIRDLVTL